MLSKITVPTIATIVLDGEEEEDEVEEEEKEEEEEEEGGARITHC